MISLTQTIFLLDVLCKPDDKHRKSPHRHTKKREKSKNVTMEMYHITKEDSKRGRKGETIKHPENNEEDSICMSLVKSLSRVRLFATPWTVAYQAPPSMGFSRQEYWSGLPFVLTYE